MEVEDIFLANLEEIEVILEVSEKISLVNHVAEVGRNGQTCNVGVLKTILAPNFKKHAVHSKKSIHILVRIKRMTSTTLIDCVATNNFINLAFMRNKVFNHSLWNRLVLAG